MVGQKAPSAKRCIKTKRTALPLTCTPLSQNAPSAKRCIKTGATAHDKQIPHGRVRKHRAPKGALRPGAQFAHPVVFKSVRKHRAPKGALRRQIQRPLEATAQDVRKHRAPKGALRPVTNARRGSSLPLCVRKHRAPKGALRLSVFGRAFPSR